MRSLRALPLPELVALGLGVALVGGHLLWLWFGSGDAGADPLLGDWAYNGIILLAATLCLARGLRSHEQRSAWLFLGAGVAAWSAGEIVFSIVLADLDPTPYPSASDVLMLLFYPCAYAAIGLLMRARLRVADRSIVLDGLVAALGAGSLACAFWLSPLLVATGRTTPELLTSLAYPICDVVLLGLLVGMATLTGWRFDRTSLLLGLGLAAMVAGDVAFLVQSARGSYVEGGLVDVAWPAAALLLAAAATLPSSPTPRARLADGRVLAVPVLFSFVALGVLVWGAFGAVGGPAVALAIAALAAVVVRMASSVREHQREVDSQRVEARTDALTGLRNRRALIEDLGEVFRLADRERPSLLLLFDLDGFKSYNDAFGHPAGDVLLAGLGRRFETAVGPAGRAYRLGGDEFAALVSADPMTATPTRRAAVEALSLRTPTFYTGTSVGEVSLADEARDVSGALRIADRRLYGDKASHGAVHAAGAAILAGDGAADRRVASSRSRTASEGNPRQRGPRGLDGQRRYTSTGMKGTQTSRRSL